MNKNASQWLLGLLLVAFPLLTLVLVFVLATIPAQQIFMDQDELTSTTLLPDFNAINQTPERKEQFLKMSEQYPLVKELKDRLRLELDY